MTVCAACREADAVTGVLCDDCSAAICGVGQLYPEQISSGVTEPVEAALVDRWGRVHPLSRRSFLGRQLEPGGIALADPSVSRLHAEILRKPDRSFWLVDTGSANGTFVNERQIDAATRLVSGDLLFFGQVGAYFVSPIPAEPPAPLRLPSTQRPEAMKLDDLDDEGASTFLGLRAASLSLTSPSGGGGGVVTVDGASAHLTMIQFELVRILAVRMFEENGRDERVRGFVRSSELLASLPWDTPKPDDNHIKQLVRRVRRALVRAQVGDLVESRHGFGYRLRFRLDKNPVRDS
jgi:hypothetical protein